MRFDIFMINDRKSKNHAFALRTPVCKNFCLWEEGEFFAIYKIMANQIDG